MVPNSVRLVGVDNSPDMLERCQSRLSKVKRLELICGNLGNIQLVDAQLVCLNYTLQFVSPKQRGDVLKRVYAGMRTGGRLILSEKVRQVDEGQQAKITRAHEKFKRENGYSELEIAQKRQALEDVLLPLTGPENEALLREAGFQEIQRKFERLNFVSWIAEKTSKSRRE